MSMFPAFSRRNARTGLMILFAALGLMFTSPFPVEGAAPNTPGHLTGLVAHNRVTLDWDAPSGGGSPAGYRIFRKKHPHGDLTLLVTSRGTRTWKADDNAMGGKREYGYEGRRVQRRWRQLVVQLFLHPGAGQCDERRQHLEEPQPDRHALRFPGDPGLGGDQHLRCYRGTRSARPRGMAGSPPW